MKYLRAIRRWFKGKKTIIFNVVSGAFAILATADLSFIPGTMLPQIMLIIAIGNMFLRFATTGPINSTQGLEDEDDYK